ncbi:nucleotide disphospho-sugar-binding domain-containing protein [Streptomyces sp. NPDC021622]|uniref:glycosyltransferase n=1 Tax=Streptomyces sp. NPDC021622 TaxID=3155013 RepID=UPI0033E5252E
MRVLFVAGRSPSGLLHMLPLARALVRGGHRVRVWCRAQSCDAVARAGLVPVLGDPTATATLWRPDLLVGEPTGLGGMDAGAMSGVPVVCYLPYRPAYPPSGTDLTPDVWVDPCPPALRADGVPGAWSVCCEAYEPAGDDPLWPAARSSRPRVLIVGGSPEPGGYGGRQSDLFHRSVEGASALDLDVLIRYGHDQPWSRLLPGCAAVVHQGDAGAVYAAALHGVPQLALNSGYPEERRSGALLESAGVGRCLYAAEPDRQTSGLRLRFHIAELVHGGRALPAASRLSQEISQLPGAQGLVARLEALAGAGRD